MLQFQHRQRHRPQRGNISRRRGRARRRGFASNSHSLRVVTRFTHRYLETISSPFRKRRWRNSLFSGREINVRSGRGADDLKGLVHAADQVAQELRNMATPNRAITL